MKPSLLFAACLCAAVPTLYAATLRVGSGQAYSKPSLAIAAARDGDTIVIGEGTWNGDVCYCPPTKGVTVVGAGAGKTVLNAAGSVAGRKGIWVVTGTGWTVRGVTFKGAAISRDDGFNAAGIRYEGDGPLTVDGCSFEGNQNGILCGALEHATIVVTNSLFRANGAGDGYSHNLYIGRIRELGFFGCVSDHALGGHDLKSRALRTTVLDSVFDDGTDGTSSYLLDCPNGGDVTVKGCRFVKSPKSSNGSCMIAVGEEGAYKGSVLRLGENGFTDRKGVRQRIRLAEGVRLESPGAPGTGPGSR